MDIRPMTLPDLRRALSWAAAEGWNPGAEDAEAFYAADPEGFLMGWKGDAPVAAISAVRHSADFGFLGLYICAPAFRGQGYGWQIWQAAMRLFGTRTVGLDGVVEQQGNYAKSGFGLSYNTQRYLGPLAAEPSPRFEVVSPDKLAGFDAKISGITRPRYMLSWFSDAKTRQTLAAQKNGAVTALGTIRQCGEGFKIGPLYAPDAETAESLIKALVAKAGAQDLPVSIDVPSHNEPANKMCKKLGLMPVFSTARMFKGAGVPASNPTEFGIATMELG